MNALPTLGLLGVLPGLTPGTVLRVGRLRDLERLSGSLADRPSLIGHAAAHAFMGGVARVVLGATTEEGGSEERAAALEALLAEGAAAVLCPGLVDVDACRALADRLASATARLAPTPPPTLWLDAPSSAVDDVLAHRDAIGGGRGVVWVVSPALRALSPGRPRPERLGGSTVIGALVMSAAPQLGALVELERTYGPGELEVMRAAGGVAPLVASGPRRLVALASPPPPVAIPDVHDAPEAPDDAPDAVGAAIGRAIRDATEPIIEGGPRGDALWPALERAARQVLEGFVASGVISAFAVRASDGELEVGYRTPKRVREIKVRVSRLDPPQPL